MAERLTSLDVKYVGAKPFRHLIDYPKQRVKGLFIQKSKEQGFKIIKHGRHICSKGMWAFLPLFVLSGC